MLREIKKERISKQFKEVVRNSKKFGDEIYYEYAPKHYWLLVRIHDNSFDIRLRNILDYVPCSVTPPDIIISELNKLNVNNYKILVDGKEYKIQ